MEENTGENIFWRTATKYASCTKNDEKFVSEIAYMMVTLHRTGS
ncbi:MAG: hypothetical protein OEL77_09320 [Nitrosopumilus sp.]|nr:hypothetical protein [Nitrosopumilus sp.]MDH3386198.1 hypothetical protein [Nitrosopumilus sp.]